jgi:hypothetical protein
VADTARELKQLRASLPSIQNLTHMIRSDWESGKHRPGPQYRALLSAVYGVPESEVFGDDALSPQSQSGDEDEVERRRLLQALAALGVSVAPMTAALASIRESLDSALSSVADHTVSDWEEMAAEYGYGFLTIPAAELLRDLAVDVVALQQRIRATADEGRRRDLCRPGGQMAMLMALTVGALGNKREARQWSQTARHIADASADTDLRVWVRGYEAMQALYERRPPELVLWRAEEAISIAGDRPRAAVLEAMAARAQALATLGREREAEDGIRQMETLFSALPGASAHERMSPRAWPETGLRHTQSWVFTHIGHPDAARDQEAALALYPPQMLRQVTQIQLLQATTLVRQGDIAEGLEHAGRALEALPDGQRTIGVRRGAHTVLAVVPAAEAERPAVAEYRERLALSAGK